MCGKMSDKRVALFYEKNDLLKKIILSSDSSEIDMLTKKVTAIDALSTQQRDIEAPIENQKINDKIKSNVAEYVERTKHCGWFTCVPGCGHD